MAALGTEVVSDLRRATGVKHDRRTEPSATNTANAGSPKYQLNLAVTSTANDGWKTFTRQGSLVRSQYRPPPTTRCSADCQPALPYLPPRQQALNLWGNWLAVHRRTVLPRDAAGTTGTVGAGDAGFMQQTCNAGWAAVLRRQTATACTVHCLSGQPGMAPFDRRRRSSWRKARSPSMCYASCLRSA